MHKIILNNSDDQLSHFVVNSGTWFSMETKGEYSLIGCTVSPPFNYNDFELAAPGWSPKNFNQNHQEGLREHWSSGFLVSIFFILIFNLNNSLYKDKINYNK